MSQHIFNIARTTIYFTSDIHLEEAGFCPALTQFLTNRTYKDGVFLDRHFSLPDNLAEIPGKIVLNQPPWRIVENLETGHHHYFGINSLSGNNSYWTYADFSPKYIHAIIYSPPELKEQVLQNGLNNLTGFPSDNLWLANLMVDRNGLIMHSSAAILGEYGLVFAGRSEAGKTTIFRMLQKYQETHRGQVATLCDETNIIRSEREGHWNVYGTWGHGEEPRVRDEWAPLGGIFILQQSNENSIEPLNDQQAKLAFLLSTFFRPIMTERWWNKTLGIVEKIVTEVPFYTLKFDLSGKIVDMLLKLNKPTERLVLP